VIRGGGRPGERACRCRRAERRSEVCSSSPVRCGAHPAPGPNRCRRRSTRDADRDLGGNIDSCLSAQKSPASTVGSRLPIHCGIAGTTGSRATVVARSAEVGRLRARTRRRCGVSCDRGGRTTVTTETRA
jgi:hypothetical protein